jgi:hypothetical protein
MPHLVWSVLLIAGASVLAAARVEAASDVLEAVIANGPYAGTYRTPDSDLICMNSPANNMYAATWTNLDEVVKDVFGAQGEKKTNQSAMHSASIRVLNPKDPGAKLGDVSLDLRNPDATKNALYELKSVPISLTTKGKGADISFDGKTKDGIQLRVTAKCSEMVQM